MLINDLAWRLVIGCSTQREKAIILHNYVRDNVKFGFTRSFDAATPEFTLAFGYGHCNPKSRLMVTLFRAVGLESYQHFVAIPKEILRGVLPTPFYAITGPELSHSYVEVCVDDVWCDIDSFIVDTPLLKTGQARLAQEGRTLGYGTRIGATNQWDGRSSAFSEFDKSILIEDHGRVDNLEAFFSTPAYRHRVLGVRLNTLYAVAGRVMVPAINAQIDRVRSATLQPQRSLS